jgi:DNA-binding transcriptional regulator GbsR (MarR family)
MATKTSESIEPQLAPEMKDLSFQIGSFIEFWGFKKIQGQIWTHIFLSPTPLDATTLVKRLNVSKALVSLAIKELLQYDVIQVVGRGGKRKVLFASNPDLMKVITSVLRLRERKMLCQIMSSCKNLKKIKLTQMGYIEADSEKLDQLSEMIETAECTLDTLIESNAISFTK